MTSRGAIKLVKEVYQDDLERVPSNTCLKLIIEGLEQAEEDLEMLELVKRYLAVDPNIIFGEGEKIEKIRKWLENDK